MKNHLMILLSAFLLVSCQHRCAEQELMSIQFTDRNGFVETISIKEKLLPYQKVNFLEPQPHNKVLRVYSKSPEGLSRSSLTTYHPNGLIHQSLEIQNGRAIGSYKEWYPTGTLKAEVTVLDGLADIDPSSQTTWIFEGTSIIYYEDGATQAQISYFKGNLEGVSYYYYPNGSLKKVVPYHKNALDGEVIAYYEDGSVQSSAFYKEGILSQKAKGFWENHLLAYEEIYDALGNISCGTYYSPDGILVSQIEKGNGFKTLYTSDENSLLIEYKNGKEEGLIQEFHKTVLQRQYYVKNGMKEGVEIQYRESMENQKPHPKVIMEWYQDMLQGTLKTYYSNDRLESQRDYYNNKKQGLSLAYYEDGNLLLVEEYENDLLQKGSYFKKGDKNPISTVENGSGIATLFDVSGNFMKKIRYEKGKPENY